MTKHDHYKKDVSHLHTLDVYRVIGLFKVTDPCIQHAVKKLLVAGGRGAGKDFDKDIQEAIDSLQRLQEMRNEDAAKPIPGAGIIAGGSIFATHITPAMASAWESAAAHGIDATHDPVTLNPTQLSTAELSVARSRMPQFALRPSAEVIADRMLSVNVQPGIL
jgi:hypothetical protein